MPLRSALVRLRSPLPRSRSRPTSWWLAPPGPRASARSVRCCSRCAWASGVPRCAARCAALRALPLARCSRASLGPLGALARQVLPVILVVLARVLAVVVPVFARVLPVVVPVVPSVVVHVGAAAPAVRPVVVVVADRRADRDAGGEADHARPPPRRRRPRARRRWSMWAACTRPAGCTAARRPPAGSPAR